MTRENWYQVLAIVLPMMMTGGLMIGSGTWFLSDRIAAGQHTIDVLSSRVAADEERITAMEKLEAGHYAEELAFRSEMRAALGRVTDLLSDVRVAVGQHSHSK